MVAVLCGVLGVGQLMLVMLTCQPHHASTMSSVSSQLHRPEAIYGDETVRRTEQSRQRRSQIPRLFGRELRAQPGADPEVSDS